MTTIAYYVSGHGFGHARRTAPVLRALVASDPELRIVVRTAAPAGLFAGIERTHVVAPAEDFDPGAVERDPLTVDPAATVRRLEDLLSRRRAIVEAEAAFLRDAGARLVIADVPFLAADAAEAVGIPAVAVGNFTWDWIYEPYTTAETRPLIDAVRDSYRKMRVLYQVPLGHEVTNFRAVVPVPMLAQRSAADRAATLSQLGVDLGDARPRVLVAMRGGIEPQSLRHAAAESPDVLYFANQSVDGRAPNLRTLDGRGLDFTDILAACDAVISKVGYGIVSDCIANGVALLYPPRSGFREDEITLAVAPGYVRMRRMSIEDFRAGRWRSHVLEMLNQPEPAPRMRTDGDQVIANGILRWIS